MKIENLPIKYESIWDESLPYLKKGRPGDDVHALEVAKFILEYSGKLKIDKDVLIPVAIMHDIGHSAILPEHFKFITGEFKLINGKLVHMLAGAKIAKDILEKVGYDKKNSQEIIEIISIHDADQLKGVDVNEIYNTENKKVFHDIDSMDRFTSERFKQIEKLFPTKTKDEIRDILEGTLKGFFYDEFRDIAKKRLQELKNE